MTKSYNDITKRVAGNMAKLRKEFRKPVSLLAT